MPSDEQSVPQGRLDVTVLQTMGRRANSHPLVASWQCRPDSLSPRHMEIQLDLSAYPAGVTEARFDVRWFTTDDYSLHYVEMRDNGSYQCRWDRHPKPDVSRTHFHPPPDAGTAEGSSLSLHHLDVLFTVLDWVSERVEQLHE